MKTRPGNPGFQKQGDLPWERVLVLPVFDAGLGRVGNDKAYRRQLRARFDLVPLTRRAENLLDGVVLLDDLHRLPVGDAAQTRVVEASALIQDSGRWCEVVANRLDNADKTVEIGLVVHLLHHPVNEATQEISFAELQNLDRLLHMILLG